MSYVTVNTSLLNGSTGATITPAMSGTTFICSKNAGADTPVRLPFPSIPGLYYRFYCTGTPVAFAINFSSSATDIIGSLSRVNGSKFSTGNTPVTIVSFTTLALNGDMIDLVSDGTNWRCEASTVQAGISFTA